LADLLTAKYTKTELHAVGFSDEEISMANNLLSDNVSGAAEIGSPSLPVSSSSSSSSVSANNKNKNADPTATTSGFDFAKCLKGLGFSLSQLKTECGFTKEQLEKAGYTIASNNSKDKSQDKNITNTSTTSASQLQLIREASMVAAVLKEVSSKDEENGGSFDLSLLLPASFTALELKEGGFTATEIKRCGVYSIDDFVTAKFSIKDMTTAGFTDEELKQANIIYRHSEGTTSQKKFTTTTTTPVKSGNDSTKGIATAATATKKESDGLFTATDSAGNTRTGYKM